MTTHTHTHTHTALETHARAKNEINVPNRTLFHGDNLQFLQGLNSNTINLIYADPPFNKNRDFYSDPDSLAGGGGFEDRWRWDEDVHDDWVESIKTDRQGVHAVIEASKLAYGMDMAAFLCWLGVRIMECQRVLSENGSMFLHIDHTAHAWVKCVMDDIFGKRNFRNEIVWAYAGPSNTNRYFPQKHDTLLWYSKGDGWTFNPDSVRVPYKRISGTGHNSLARGGRSDDEVKEIEKRYEKRGRLPADWWPDIAGGGHISRKERTGYKTQKPLKLLRRIILAASSPGDMVLDPFCGCATTPIAAEQTGRRWIGMDLWDKAHEMVLSRLQQNNLAVPDVQFQGQGDLIPFGYVHYTQSVPKRTDDMKVAVADFELEPQAPLEPWERLRAPEMREILMKAQAGVTGLIVCVGCGRQLEPEFMELDHNHPKSLGGENVITNRILLCRPCNGAKGYKDTIAGLWDVNRESKWMRDDSLAGWMYRSAVKETQRVKRRMRQ